MDSSRGWGMYHTEEVTLVLGFDKWIEVHQMEEVGKLISGKEKSLIKGKGHKRKMSFIRNLTISKSPE